MKKGDRIAIQSPNVLQYPVALFGAIRSGIIVVNTNPLYTPDEMRHQFKDSGCKAILILSNFAYNLEKIINDTAIEHVIISDMAADTTGNKSLDSIRTNQLCADVLNFSKLTLKPKGVLVSKLFMGEDFVEVKNLAKSIFKKVSFFKPESSRKESKETYLHCEILKSL